ncbi:MAG TPA: sugar phosphate isomerase/epimerase family protein [Vicinamibacterales bacterium]
MGRTLDRRTFLTLTAGAAAAGAASLDAWAGPPGAPVQTGRAAQKFRVGHNLTTYISGGRGPDGFWKGVAEIAGLGVRGTEADDGPSRLTATYGSTPGEVKERLDKHGMTLVALYHTLPVSDPAKLEENIASGMRVGRFLKEVGGEILNLAGGPRPQPDPTAEFQAFAKLVNELGKRLQGEYGIRLGYHPHRGHLLETHEEIARAMEMTDPRYFSLCPDTGHLLAAGSDPLKVFKTFRSRIIYMHYKDYDPNLETPRTAQTGRRGGFVELGKGAIDFRPITDLLLTTGYDGWVMIELDRAPAAEIDAVRTSLAYMTDTLGLRLG